MKGPVEPVHRSVPETIQEVIELTGFLCFLFRSTPTEDVKYGLQVTFYLPKYCKKVPIYCIKIQVKSWFVAINTSTEK